MLMRRSIILFAFAFALLSVAAGCAVPAPAAAPDSSAAPEASHAPSVVEATVVKHTDGDTAHLRLPDGTEETVRFIGIDAPEVGARLEPFGEEASAYTAAAIPLGATVWLETDVELRDRYGRLLAYVWLQEPASADESEVRRSMLNARLVADGFAAAATYPPNVAYTDVLLACQREARESGRGLWEE